MSIRGVIFLLYQVAVIATIVHVLMDNRQPAKTVAWALVIYFVPVAGIIAYIFFGTNTRRERFVSRRSMDQLTKRSMLQFAEQKGLTLPAQHKQVTDLFINENFALPFSGNRVDILTSGYDFFPSLLRDMAQATSHIHIDVYIFADDALGRLVADALVAKARQGVEVRVVYDDVGCWRVHGRFFENMRREGIEVEPFMPVRFPSFARRANYRNHRKLYVIDGRVGYIGGMNIAERYVKGLAGAGQTGGGWRDTMLRVEGRGVFSLQRAFLIDWYFVDRTLLSDRKYYPISDIEHSECCSGGDVADGGGQMHGGTSPIVQTVTSGPASPIPEIMHGYVRIIMAASEYVYIETPYFLPNEPVLFAIKTAARAGVDVRMLCPRRSDARFTDWASRSYLREVYESGVKVYLYESGFLHSKLMVCDDSIATCGSTNVDFRSFENNFEGNAFIYDEGVAIRLRNVFLRDQEQSVLLSDLPQRIHPSFTKRLWESLTRLLSPLL